MVIEDYDLFDLDIYYWRFELNIDLPHFPELISRIDEHLGREICYLQETQDYLIGSFLVIGRLSVPMPYNVEQKIQISSTNLGWIGQMII
jgi:hypothetical protein